MKNKNTILMCMLFFVLGFGVSMFMYGFDSETASQTSSELDSTLTELMGTNDEGVEMAVQSIGVENWGIQSNNPSAGHDSFDNTKSKFIKSEIIKQKKSKYDEFADKDPRKERLLMRNTTLSTYKPNSDELSTINNFQEKIRTMIDEGDQIQKNYAYGTFLSRLLESEEVLYENKSMKKLYYIEMMKKTILDAYYEVNELHSSGESNTVVNKKVNLPTTVPTPAPAPTPKPTPTTAPINDIPAPILVAKKKIVEFVSMYNDDYSASAMSNGLAIEGGSSERSSLGIVVPNILDKKVKDISSYDILGYKKTKQGDSDFYKLYVKTNAYTDLSVVTGFYLQVVVHPNSGLRFFGLGTLTNSTFDKIRNGTESGFVAY